jgi:hypothetical protein
MSSVFRQYARRELIDRHIPLLPRKLVSTRLAHGNSSLGPGFRQDCEVERRALPQILGQPYWARLAVEYAPWYSGP